MTAARNRSHRPRFKGVEVKMRPTAKVVVERSSVERIIYQFREQRVFKYILVFISKSIPNLVKI